MELKRKLFFVIAGLIAFGLISCGGKKQGDLLYYNDFESYQGWNCAPYQIMKGIGKSGNFSGRTDSLAPYSYVFQIDLATVSNKPLKKVRASMYVLLSKPNLKGDLVVEVFDKDNKNLSWNSVSVGDFTKNADEWVEVYKDVDLTKNNLNNPGNIIKVCFWNQSKERINIDDYEIKFEEL